jgi:hypothetical protein
MGSAVGGERMKHCGEWQKTLWLDVHGELSPQVRLNWEKHLKECKPCFQERIHLLNLLKNVNEAVPEATLSHEGFSDLYNTITEKLKAQRDKNKRKESFFGGYIKPVYVLAACCLLIMVFGWFGLKGFQHPPSGGTVSELRGKEQLIATDMDLLENLELLEEMDTLEKLDQIMGKGQTKI